jgi:PAS domain S-box-containing protein
MSRKPMKEDEGSAAISPSSEASVGRWFIFLRVLSIIFVAEFLVMILLWRIDVAEGVFEFLLDSLFLSVLSAPFLYYLVVKVVADRLAEKEAMARKALEEALTTKAYAEKMALKAYSDNIVSSVPSGLVALSRDLDVKRVNPSVCRMFSADESDLVGRPFHEALPFHGLAGPVEEVLSTGRSVKGLVIESSISGQNRYYQASVNEIPFMEGDGEQRILLAFEDITERKRSEDKVVFMAHHDNLTGLPN